MDWDCIECIWNTQVPAKEYDHEIGMNLSNYCYAISDNGGLCMHMDTTSPTTVDALKATTKATIERYRPKNTPEILVTNMKDYPTFDIPKNVNYVGRTSPLGNPFRIGPDGTREEVISKFRKYLWKKIEMKDPDICAELGKLMAEYKTSNKLTLGCHCMPEACHAEIVADCIEWMNGKK